MVCLLTYHFSIHFIVFYSLLYAYSTLRFYTECVELYLLLGHDQRHVLPGCIHM